MTSVVNHEWIQGGGIRGVGIQGSGISRRFPLTPLTLVCVSWYVPYKKAFYLTRIRSEPVLSYIPVLIWALWATEKNNSNLEWPIFIGPL